MEKKWWEKSIIKRKGRNSLSIPKKQNAGGGCSLQTMTRPHRSKEKEKAMRWRSTNKNGSSSSTRSSSTRSSSTHPSASVVDEEDTTIEIDQTSNESNMEDDDDDGWITDTSIEMMRSSELLSLDEVVNAPPVSIGNSDLASFEFLPVAYSTPLPLPESFPVSEVFDSIKKAVPKASSTLRSNVVTRHGEPLALPYVSFENGFVKESETLRDQDFQLKSISPEQNIQLPDISADVNNESQKLREDSFACSEAPSSDGFNISEDSVECTKQNFDEDDEYNKNNPFAATNSYDTVVKESTNSDSRKRKQKGKERNLLSKVWCNYSEKEDFGESQNMQVDYSKKQEKGYGAYNRMDESIIRWKKKIERENLLEYKSDSENNFQNVQKIQNKEFQDDNLDNNQIQPVSLQINRKVNIFTGVDNKRQQDASIINTSQSRSSTSLRRNLFEDVDKSDRDDSFENVKNIQNEELQDYGSEHQETTTHQRQINSRFKFVSNRNRSTNSNQKKNYKNKIGNSSQDVGKYNRAVNFEKAETPKKKGTPHRRIKLKFSNPLTTPQRKKHTNKKGKLFDMDRYDDEDSFEKVQNIKNEELKDGEMENNQLETAVHNINTKNNKHANNMTQQDADITNRSQSSTSLREKHKPDKNDKEKSFENVQNMQIGNVQNIYIMRVDNLNKTQLQTAARNRSRSSTSLRRKHRNGGRNLSEDVHMSDRDNSFENVQNIQNEELQDDGMDNTQQETAIHKANKKFDKHVVDNIKQQDADITNTAQSSTSLRRKHKIDKNDRENSFENVQNIQNKELQDDELNNDQPQTAALQIKRKVKMNQEASILNRLQSSTSLRWENRTEEGDFSGDVDKSDRDGSFESVKNIQNEELQDNELDHQETVTHRRQTNNRVKLDNILNRSANSYQKKKRRNKIGSSFENVGNCNRAVNFEKAATPKKKRTPHRRITNRIKTPGRKKHINKGENLFDNMDKNVNVDSFENFQNIQNEELQDDEVYNNQPETAIHKINKKINKHIKFKDITQGDVNISNISSSSTSLRRKHEPDKNDRDNSFENVQNVQNKELQDNELNNNQLQTATPQIKRKTNKHGGVDNKSQQFAGTLNRSKSSTSLRRKHKNEGENVFKDMEKNDNENGFESVQNIQNELQDDEMDNKQPRTATHKINRKKYKHVGADNITQQEGNITNRSRSSASLERNYRNEGENSIDESFVNVQKNQNDWDKARSSLEDDNKRGYNFEEAQYNEATTSWPHCCLKESAALHSGQTFRILQPVFRDDVPIDSLTVVNLGFKNKMKCKH